MGIDLPDLPPMGIDLRDSPSFVQFMGIDLPDLPPLIQADNVCLHQRTDHAMEVMEGLLNLETDKAVSDPLEQSNHVKFSRVFMVGDSCIVIPKSTKPLQGSPRKRIYFNPGLCERAIASTFRIRMTYVQEDKQKKQFFGTAFRVAPSISLTAGHCLQAQAKHCDMKLSLKEMCGCSINPNLLEYFEKSSRTRFCISSLSEGTSWGGAAAVSVQGLYQTGSDVAFLKHKAHAGQGFLLPCSPRHPFVRSDIAVLSYPDPQSFLQAAKVQLSSKENTPIWDTYRPAMAVPIAQAMRRLAKELGVLEDAILASEDLLSQVHMEVKHELLKQLITTFGKFSSGNMLASIGTMIVEEFNDSCVGTRVSLLAGSSGGAILCISLPGYFIGVHSGGSPGFDLNVATSTDCPDFCAEYIEKVLPKLPLPDSGFWTDIDLAPFLDWIARHSCLINVESPWLKASRAVGKAIKSKATSRKKARRG